jgi:hypothetical protein
VARPIAPILLGLAVTCWRVRQRPVSSANPRSLRQRRERSTALRVRLPISSSRPVLRGGRCWVRTNGRLSRRFYIRLPPFLTTCGR